MPGMIPNSAPQKNFPFYPWLLVTFPFLHLLASNLEGNLEFSQLWNPYLLALSLSGVFWLAGILLFKSLRKAALAVSILILFFFSYGHVRNVVLLYILETNIP